MRDEIDDDAVSDVVGAEVRERLARLHDGSGSEKDLLRTLEDLAGAREAPEEARQRAARHLAEGLKPPALVVRLGAWISDRRTPAPLRRIAAWGLAAHVAAPGFQKILVRAAAARDEDWDVRTAAISSLTARAGAPMVVSMLLDVAGAESDPESVRCAAIESLSGPILAPRVLSVLLGLAEREATPGSVRHAAIAALCRRPPGGVVREALEKLACSAGDRSVRDVAASLLGLAVDPPPLPAFAASPAFAAPRLGGTDPREASAEPAGADVFVLAAEKIPDRLLDGLTACLAVGRTWLHRDLDTVRDRNEAITALLRAALPNRGTGRSRSGSGAGKSFAATDVDSGAPLAVKLPRGLEFTSMDSPSGPIGLLSGRIDVVGKGLAGRLLAVALAAPESRGPSASIALIWAGRLRDAGAGSATVDFPTPALPGVPLIRAERQELDPNRLSFLVL